MIERTPTWVLFAILVAILGGVVALWVLILAGAFGHHLHWFWGAAIGAFMLGRLFVLPRWKRRRRSRPAPKKGEK